MSTWGRVAPTRVEHLTFDASIVCGCGVSTLVLGGLVYVSGVLEVLEVDWTNGLRGAD